MPNIIYLIPEPALHPIKREQRSSLPLSCGSFPPEVRVYVSNDSLQSGVYILPLVYPKPAVCIPQSAICSDSFFQWQWYIGFPGRGGGYLGFQVTGIIEGFFGFEIFNSGIFLGLKIQQVFFGQLDLSRDFLGVLKIISSALAAYTQFCE